MPQIPKPSKGIDMLSPELDMPPGAVRSARNVDISTSGHVRRRDGYTLVDSGQYHSGHVSDRGALAVRGSELCVLDTTNDQILPILDLGVADPVDFCEYNGDTYLTNGHQLLRLPREGAPQVVGVPLPPTLPDMSEHPNGALTPGRYGVALSAVADDGEESGAKFLGTIELPSGGGIMLNGFAVNPSFRYRLYITDPNGTALYLTEEIQAVFEQFVITQPGDGAIRMTANLEPLPAGQFVMGYNGRLFVARDDVLYFSQALRPHLHDPRHDFVKLVGNIRFVEAVDDGLYVGDDRGVVFLSGSDPTRFRQQLVSTHKAVRRSALVVPRAYFNPEFRIYGDEVVVWLSEAGYVLGAQQGVTIPLQHDRIRIDPAVEGRSRLLVRDGVKQIITLVAATDIFGYGLANNFVGDQQ